MAKQQKTRRDALREIVGTMAAAAALSSTQIGNLLAQVKKVPDIGKLRRIQPTSNATRALKVLLAPRSQAAQVFESEFGRKPALAPSKDAKTGRSVCPAYLGVAATCADLGCSLVACNALAMPAGEVPAEQAQQYGKSPSNPANTGGGGGGCSYTFKPAWGCTEACTAKCTIVVPPTGGMNLARVNPAWLRAVKDDPYIQGLMQEFGVTRAEDLEGELTQALAKQRAGK